jgi:hypothetical protein
MNNTNEAMRMARSTGLIARLKNPEQHYEFTDPKKANAVLMSLCQEAADALAAPVQPMAHIVGEIDHTGKVWKPVQPAPVQPVAWQPIASAPKDGTRILCQNEKGLVNICEWTQCSATGDRFTSSDDRTFGSGPAYTSWMPLPQPIESTPPAQPAPAREDWGPGPHEYHSLPSQPAPVQEPVFELQKSGWEIICDLDWIQTLPFGTKLYTTPPAQPAVPDAIGPNEDELPAYAAGWNDCRQTMLEMMK